MHTLLLALLTTPLATPPPLQEEAAAPEPAATLEFEQAVGGLALVGDSLLAVGDALGRVRLFARDGDALGSEPERRLQADDAPVYAVGASPEGRWLAVSHLAGAVRLFDLTDEARAEPSTVFATVRLAPRDLAFSHDGRWLAFAGADGRLRRYDLGRARRSRPASTPTRPRSWRSRSGRPAPG